jgi:hypothetical protein
MASRVKMPEAQVLYDNGWTLEQLGEHYGVSRERVRQKIRTHKRTGIPCRLCGKPFNQQTMLGFHCNTCVQVKHKEQQLKVRQDQCTCGKMKSKISEMCCDCRKAECLDEDQMVAMFKQGYSAKYLASMFNVSRPAIYHAFYRVGFSPRKWNSSSKNSTS